MMIKKLLFSTLFILSVITVTAQFTDDFTDANFTTNPTWTVSQGAYIVETGDLKQNDVGAGTSIITTPSTAACNASWEFSVRNDFSPSTGNNSSIYFMSDIADLSGSVNGYFVKVGGISGTDDSLELYKSINGTATKILGGTKAALGTSPNLRIKITRDANGTFELFADYSGGVTFVSQGTVTDISVTSSNFFGIKNKYTSTRKDKFFFDNFNVTGGACNISIQQGGLYINRIIATACGTPEIQNELVKFTVGNSPLNANNLQVDWPTITPWDGLVQNATTAAKIAAMNAQIVSATACGKFVEPTNGILPAGADVFLLSSYLFDEAAWNFGQLKDTIYVLFQNSNRTTGGYFKNFDVADNTDRVLALSFGTQGQDTVKYIPSNLIQDPSIAGSYKGTGVDYDTAGVATYINEGCLVPLATVGVTIDPNVVVKPNTTNTCGGDTIILTGLSKNAATRLWSVSGDNGGQFINNSATNDIATYVTKTPVSKTLTFTYAVIDKCGAADNAQLPVSISSAYPTLPTPSINTTDVCAGQTINLSTTSTGTIVWSANNGAAITNSTSQNASLATTTSSPASITFTLREFGRCPLLDTVTAQKAVLINQLTPPTFGPNPVSVCPETGKDTLVTAAGGHDSYIWSDASGTVISTSSSIKVTALTVSVLLQGVTAACTTSVVNIPVTVTTPCNPVLPSSISLNGADLAFPNSKQPVIYKQAQIPANKRMHINLVNVTNYKLKIWDRWGKVVYENSDPTLTTWEGTKTNGKELNPGTYFYVVSATAQSGNNLEYKGYVAIIGN